MGSEMCIRDRGQGSSRCHQQNYRGIVRCTTYQLLRRWIPLVRQERTRVTIISGRRDSTYPSPAVHDAFTSELLAGHFQNESFKLYTRQIFADAL